MDDFSSIIDLIYELTDDQEHLPLLFSYLRSIENNPDIELYDALIGEIRRQGWHPEGKEYPSTALEAEGMTKLAQSLRGHLRRSLKLASQYQINHRKLVSLQQAIDELPVGHITLSFDRQILNCNQTAKHIVSQDTPFKTKNGRLFLRPPELNQKLSTIFQKLKDSDHKALLHSLTCPYDKGGSTLSILVSGINSSHEAVPDTFNLLISRPYPTKVSSSQILQELYNLTQAEGETVFYLLNGLSIEEICKQRGVTQHTVKAHLKSAFAKTQTSGQVDLIRLVMRGPATYYKNTQKPTNHSSSADSKPITRRDCMTLDDGRTIGFSTQGSPSASNTVVFFNGMYSGQEQLPTTIELLERYDTNLLIPERPGYGNSTPFPEASFKSHADDVSHLIAHLGIQNAYFVGYSAGGAYCCATTYYYPGLSKGQTLVSSIAPCFKISEIQNVQPTSSKLVLALGLYSPQWVQPVVRLFGRSITHNQEKFARGFLNHINQSDRLLLESSGILDQILSCAGDKFNNNEKGLVLDATLIANRWPFSLADIKVKTHIWHGADDATVPWALAKNLERIPSHQTHLLPNRGHFFIYDYWQTILRESLQQHTDVKSPVTP